MGSEPGLPVAAGTDSDAQGSTAVDDPIVFVANLQAAGIDVIGNNWQRVTVELLEGGE